MARFRIIPSLYTERRRKPIEREAVERIRMYFRNQSLNTCFEQQQQQQDNDDEQTGISSELNDSDMPFPFDVLLSEIAYRRKEEDEGECYTGTVVDTLSIVISSLYRRLKENSTDNTIIIVSKLKRPPNVIHVVHTYICTSVHKYIHTYMSNYISQ